MGLTVGVPLEKTPGERRVALVPEMTAKLKTLGARVLLQAGAGKEAHFSDEDFREVEIVDNARDLYAQSDLVLKVQPPDVMEIAAMKPGATLVGLLQPYGDAERIKQLQARGITAFAMELLPRVSRAQSMDVLSSQAAVSGYECALIAADHSPKFFPMLTYAAGTIRPAKVLVIGAGVAGLQAIATARRIGASVEAYDVRPETKEQIESLGAKFVGTGISAAGSGGYARELSTEEKQRQAELLRSAVARCDALIATAAIPGKRAPRIVSADMLAGMKPGSVAVDMAAESGGNIEGSIAGEKVWVGKVLIIGAAHLPSRMPVHASEMLSRNLFNFISPFIKGGELALDWSDEVLAGTCLTHAGEIRSVSVTQVLGIEKSSGQKQAATA